MNAIEVRDLHKKFKVYYDKGLTLKERLLFHSRNSYEDRWVLRGLSFDVAQGEAVGFIGENGSGKSTLLKLLTRILYPDQGTVTVRGRVSSLIELGAGFHPDMSGRENIYLNAAIFGLKRYEIDRRLDDIISFSELESYIDNPIRTYSSGMYMRLAFAVAINVDADVLLIDEILAVGDANFQKKCFNHLKEIKRKGTTIVIVSHSLSQIEEICERSLWIDNGLLRMAGAPENVHRRYMAFMANKQNAEQVADNTNIIARKTHIEGRLDTEDIHVEICPAASITMTLATREISLQIANRTKQIFSSASPYPVMVSYHILDERGREVVYDGLRTAFTSPLIPQETCRIKLNVDLSGLKTPGNYVLIVTLVQESQFWFDDYNPDAVFPIKFSLLV